MQSGKHEREKINFHWIKTFWDLYHISHCTESCKRGHYKSSNFSKNRGDIYNVWSEHLIVGKSKEEGLSSANNSHIVVNMENWHTLVVDGDEVVHYTNVMSGRGMTVAVILSPVLGAIIEPPPIVIIETR